MFCPADIVINDATGNELRVNWNPPVATDNSGNTPAIRSNNQPGSLFLVPGSYEITYKATDQAGNFSYCSFRITIECKYFRNWGKRGGGTRVGEVGG